MRPVVQVFSVLLIAAYPVLVYFGMQVLPLSYLGYLLIALAAIRFVTFRPGPTGALVQLVLAGLLVFAALYTLLEGDARGFRFYPVAVNTVFLIVFSSSLFEGRPIIERIARLSEPDLPSESIPYTRKVTQVWCFFFLANGLASLYTAACASIEIWAFYNGFLSYTLMGVLFAGEWLVRRSVRSKTNVAPH